MTRSVTTEPLIEVAIEPRTREDQAKLVAALEQLAPEDSTFRVTSDAESGQTVIAGMSAEHLDSMVARLRREFGVEANTGAPQVAYRETITRRVEQACRGLTIRFEPLAAGSGFAFENRETAGDAGAVESALKAVSRQGCIAGFPMIDFKAVLLAADGRLDATARAIAASACYREAIPRGNPVLLEPIMRLEVTMPVDFLGDVFGDMESRRGKIGRMEARGEGYAFDAIAPLSNLLSYGAELRSLCDGRANFTMAFSHYERVPPTTPDDRFPPAVGMRA